MSRTLIIAEVGLAHDGSLNQAAAYIEAVASTGVDGVKFQIHHPSEGTLNEPWRVRWSRYRESRADYWQRTAFAPVEWGELSQIAWRHGLQFGASVFCPEAADILWSAVPHFYKISAGMVAHRPLLEHIAAKREHGGATLPVYVSAGLAEIGDLEEAMRILGDRGVLLHCVSQYPTPHDKAAWMRRHQLRVLAQAYDWSLGLSDHSGTIWPGVLACAERDAVVEVHVCWDRQQGGPDASSSLTMAELRQLVEARNALHTLRAASQPWVRPDYAALFEPTWVRERGQWVVRKNGGQGRSARLPQPTEEEVA